MLHKKNWYCLYVRSFHEKAVAARLEKRGFECFLPLIEEVRQWSDRKKKIKTPLFRGYLFVKTTAADTWQLLLVDAVIKFLGTGNNHSIISEEEIKKIERIVKTGWSIDLLESVEISQPGTHVEIKEGPFRGILAQIIKSEGQNIALVSIESLGQTLKIKIPTPILKAI